MNAEMIQQMQRQFDSIAQMLPEENIEFWFARDLQNPLGYARWENFLTAINRAIESCQTAGYNPYDHFRGVTKMIELGKGGNQYPPLGRFSAGINNRGKKPGSRNDQP